MKLFDQKFSSPIVLEQDAAQAIVLAAQDLQRNLRQLSGQEHGFVLCRAPMSQGGIFVQTVANGEIEQYTVDVGEDSVRIIGSDILGTVYGIYAFATKCLGILPMYRLIERFPATRECLEITPIHLVSEKRAVRFRGWFLNDEDLLTELKISGGYRNIDYPFYKDVMDTEVLDIILETALRLEINLVIPSSFVDIDNPPEEALVEAVCRRGMYVSQHHVEPLGVSYFGAENYLQKHGYKDETVSFLANRARMEEIWRYYAEKWAKYGGQVIWQLGLRGKGDQAVWKADPTIPNSMEIRGQIITDAIQTQYDIIKAATGTDGFYSTATLWNEGSELYGKGALKLPGDTVAVFADLGLDQMFGEDFYTTRREENKQYGIYYHLGFWTLGPHLTEGCNPEKMAYCYRDAARNQNLYYSILNVSNVRPFHVSATLNSRLMRDPLSFDMSREMLELEKELFGDGAEMVHALRKEYYSSFADFGEEPLKYTAEEWHFYYRQYEGLPFIRNAATDGQLTYFGKFLLKKKNYPKLPAVNECTYVELKKSAERFGKLYEKACETETRLPVESRAYFGQFLKYQIRHMQLMTEWCIGCMDLVNESLTIEERKKQGANAVAKLETILAERKVLEHGIWQNWHRGDRKINIPLLLNMTKEKYDQL